MADGRVALTFDPLFPQEREGTESRPAARMLRAAGFNLADDGENIDHPTASAFALAQQITKVEVTRDLLETASYELGIAPHPAPLPTQTRPVRGFGSNARQGAFPPRVAPWPSGATLRA